jgi:hypothetical protein
MRVGKTLGGVRNLRGPLLLRRGCMHAICVNDRLAAGRHLLNEVLKNILWQSILYLPNGRTNGLVPCNLFLILILYPILYPVPYSLDRVQIRRVGRPFEDTDIPFGKLSERFSCPGILVVIIQ